MLPRTSFMKNGSTMTPVHQQQQKGLSSLLSPRLRCAYGAGSKGLARHCSCFCPRPRAPHRTDANSSAVLWRSTLDFHGARSIFFVDGDKTGARQRRGREGLGGFPLSQAKMVAAQRQISIVAGKKWPDWRGALKLGRKTWSWTKKWLSIKKLDPSRIEF